MIRVGTTTGPGAGIRVGSTTFSAFPIVTTGTPQGAINTAPLNVYDLNGGNLPHSAVGSGTFALSLTATLSGSGLRAQAAFNVGGGDQVFAAGLLTASLTGIGLVLTEAPFGRGTFGLSLQSALSGTGAVVLPPQRATGGGPFAVSLQVAVSGTGEMIPPAASVGTGTWALELQVAFSGLGEVADLAPPVLLGARLTADRAGVYFIFDEPVVIGAGGAAGFALTPTGAAVTLALAAAERNVLTYSLDRRLANGETATAAYTQPGDGVQDEAGNVLASFAGVGVVAPRPLAASDRVLRVLWEPRRMLVPRTRPLRAA